MTVAKLSTGKVVGGYAGVSWASSGWSYARSPTNFVFSLSNGHRHALIAGNEEQAQVHYRSYGPTFGGGHDLYIQSDMNGGYCNLGNSYACRVGADTRVNACASCNKDIDTQSSFGMNLCIGVNPGPIRFRRG